MSGSQPAAAAAPAPEPAPAAGQAPPARGILAGTILRVAVVAAALMVAWLVATRWNAWVGAAAVQDTNDAYLTGDVTPLSARVAGLVRAVPVMDYQHVKTGDVLAEIEDRDYAAQVRQAEAALAGADAALANVVAQRELQQTNILAAAAAVQQEEALLARDEAEAERQRSLLSTGIAGTRQKVEQANATSRGSEANLARAQAGAQGAVRQLAVLEAQQKQAEATRDAQRAMLDLARINLGYTRVVSPADGVVGQRQVRPGQFVAVGTQLIAVVPLRVWVVANYKETQVANMAVGQTAEVSVDALPGQVLRGRVEAFAPASGSQFSLLPADNATGNFTKVVQRIPVKIVFDDTGAAADRLRPGMSVTARVRTRGP